MTCTRGTTNGNVRGNNTTRRQRREWLVETYRADVDAPKASDNRPPRTEREAEAFFYLVDMPLGTGLPACRCYRCGTLLTVDTVTVDRIKPGVDGGRYGTARQDAREGRTNVRPACAACNSETGGPLATRKKKT